MSNPTIDALLGRGARREPATPKRARGSRVANREARHPEERPIDRAPPSEPPSKGWEKRAALQLEQQREVLSVFQQMEDHLGGVLSIMRGPPQGDVMFSGSVTIGPNGFVQMEWPQAYDALTIANLSGSQLTVGRSSTSGAAPGVGAGVTRIPSGYFRTWSARGNGIAVFGPVGSTFDLTVYVRPRPPSSGVCGVIADSGLVVLPAGQQASAGPVNVYTSYLRDVVLVVNVSAVSGGETVTVALSGVTPSGYTYPVLTSAALGAVATTALRVGPGLPATANVSANDVVPPELAVTATIAGAGAITYGIDLVPG